MSDDRPAEAAADTGYSPDRWAFDEEVTRVFDDMLARSVPQYEVMRRLVFEIGSRFVTPATCVVDLGCSRGEAMRPFVDRFGAHNRFVGVERSAPMLAAARTAYAGLLVSRTVDILDVDLRVKYPPVSASLTLCVLTLQFTPIEHRQRILRAVYDSTVAGGALVLVEKILGADDVGNALLVAHYEEMKRQNGYTEEEIARKRLALEGVLVPVTARWNEDLLGWAGFKHVECFWRVLNFAAWVAMK
jgi:tRNA (cmo5U34)-methyltransferase